MKTETILQVGDNSGARQVMFIRQLIPNSMFCKIVTRPGDTILVTIKKVLPNNLFKLKKGMLYKAVIILLNKNVKRAFGFIRFFANVVVLLSKKGQPFATRILYPILYEVRLKKHIKIVSLCINVF